MENLYDAILAAKGEIAASILSMAVVIGGVIARSKGWFSQVEEPKAKSDSADALRALTDKIGTIDNRLARVEGEMEHMPSRNELHALQLLLVELDGKIQLVERTTNSTGHAVGRLEDHFIRLSGGKTR
jgi:hypothetical protein